MMKRWIMICDKYYVSMDFDRWAKQVCTDTRECQYPLTNLHHGIISSLLVIFCKQEIQNEEYIFYCLLLSEKEQLDWVLSTKQKVKCIWHFFLHHNILTKVIFDNHHNSLLSLKFIHW